MVQGIQKENINFLFNYLSPKIHSLNQFTAYLKQIFEDYSSRCENPITALNITRFHLYMQLPYYISKQLFKSLAESNLIYLTFEEFDKGLRQLYCESIQNQIKFLFHFYDIDHDNIVYPYDIKIILRLFHMMTNQCDIALIDILLDSTLKDEKPMNYDQWKELLINNSDIFSLTFMFFYLNRPFKEDNVTYCAKITKTHVTARDIPIKIYELLSDSTELLFNYINKQFNMSLKFIAYALSDDEDMKELVGFEEDKMQLLDNMEEISMKLSENKLSKKRFETEITCDSSTIQQEIKYDRKRGREIAGTTIQSNFILSKLKLKNGIITTMDEENSSKKYVTQNSRFDCYRLYKNKIKKCFLNLLNEELYVFKFSKNNIKKYKQMMSLKQFFISGEENSKVLGGIYFKVELFSDIEFQPFPTYFYFESKESGLSFIRNVKELIKYKDKITENYEITDELMKEHNGNILKAYHKKNLNPFLIKQIGKKYKDKQSHYELINFELSTHAFLSKANHPSLLKGIERYESLNTIYLVYEFPNEGQLFYHMQKNKVNSLMKKLDIFTSIVSSIHYLHSFGIVYGNCITSNAFVFKTKQILEYKVINYGLAQICSFTGKLPQLSHTSLNKAPELFDGSHVFDRSIDIWNIGQLLFLIVYGHKPFNDKDLMKRKLIFAEIDEKEQFQMNKIKEIILGCLQSESKKRLSLAQVLDLCEMNK